MPDTRKVPVFDGHCDTATRIVMNEGVDIGRRMDDGHVDIPRMREGGVCAQVFACWVDPDTPEEAWPEYALRMVGSLRKAFAQNGGSIEIALSGSDVAAINARGRIAAVIGIEGGHAIGRDMGALERLHGEGVRCLTLTWNNDNEIADSCEGGRWGGLSPFGREAVAMMDRLGIVADLSHSSDAAFYDVLETTSKPVLVSHSCMRAICGHSRNISDDMLAALAENGGVVGVNFFPGFLEDECSRQTFALWDRYKAERSELAARYGGDVRRADEEIQPKYMELVSKIEVPGVATVVDHIVHAVEAAGVDHVAVGSDFDGTPMMPEGLEDISKMQSIAEEMERRGFSPDEVLRVMSGNLAALFTAVSG